MPPHDPFDDDDEDVKSYHESSDEDFNPTAAPADESSASSDEDNATGSVVRKGKRKAPPAQEFDSGDEATIEAAKKRRTKRRKGDNVEEDEREDDDLPWSDHEGGEGGLVKTRAQRRVEQKERRPLARTDGATVDVDALWATMSAVPLRVVDSAQTDDASAPKDEDMGLEGATVGEAAENEGDLVSIRRTYTFAGQSTTEDKQVPRSTLEKHLSDGWKAVDLPSEHGTDHEVRLDSVAEESAPKARRPLRRPSRYDPNPTGYVRALPPEYQLSWPRKAVAAGSGQENAVAPETSKVVRPEKAQKLNVVDKSRLDWTGFVDKEGIAEELDVHGKTKEAYLGRMDFLAGVEARQEEERRRMKITTAT